MRTCVKFTFPTKIEAMHERSLVSVKVEPRSTPRLSSALFTFYFIYVIKIYCGSGNQPLFPTSSPPWLLHDVTLILKSCSVMLKGYHICVLSVLGGDTPLYKPYRYVPPHRIRILRRFGLKTGIYFVHSGLESEVVFDRSP